MGQWIEERKVGQYRGVKCPITVCSVHTFVHTVEMISFTPVHVCPCRGREHLQVSGST